MADVEEIGQYQTHETSALDLAKAVFKELDNVRLGGPFQIVRYQCRWAIWHAAQTSPGWRAAKLYFKPAEADPTGGYEVGLLVEKGAGSTASEWLRACRGHNDQLRDVMDGSWDWHWFLRELPGRRFGALVDTLEQGCLRLTVEALRYVGSQVEPRGGILRFQIDDGRLVGINGPQDRSGRLASAVGAPDFAALAAALTDLPDSDSTWINFWLGVPVRRTVGCTPAEASDALQQLVHLVEPILPWIDGRIRASSECTSVPARHAGRAS